MKKSFLFVLTALILLSCSLVAAADLNLTAPAAITANHGTSNTTSFVIQNNNATLPITNISIGVSNLIGIAGTILTGNVTFSQVSLFTLSNNSTLSVTATVNVPLYTAQGAYTGTLNVSGWINGTALISNTTMPITITVLPSTSLDIVNSSLTSSTYQNTNVTLVIAIQNTGNTQLTNVNLSQVSLMQDSNTNATINLGFSPQLINLDAGQTKNVSMSVLTPSNITIGTYSTTILASTGATVNDTMPLTINVKAKYCEEGEKGSKAYFYFSQPESGDKFNISGTIKLKLKVYNQDSSDEDHDFIIYADLYDLNSSQFVDAENQTSSIINGASSDTIYLDLAIPSDIDETHSYVVYTKAYIDDGSYSENDQCSENYQTIRIARQTHDVSITSFTIDPNSINCGRTTYATVKIANLGKNDEDSVMLRVYNSELGINSSKIIDTFDKDETSEPIFTISVPEGTTEGNYTLGAESKFYYKSESYHKTYTKTAILEVKGTACIASAATLATLATNVITNNATGIAGSQLIIPVIISNTGTAAQTYVIAASNYESWATLNSTLISLSVDAGKNATAYILLTPKSSVSGVQNLTLTTTYGGKTDSKTVSVNVQKSSAISSWFDQFLFELKSNPVWITIDIALIGAIIYVIVWLFTKK